MPSPWRISKLPSSKCRAVPPVDLFSQQALDKYSAQDFEDAGFPDWVRGRVSEIAMHEQTHVNLLSAALGNSSVAACEYSLYV